MPHKNITRRWFEWSVEDGSHCLVLVLETDLEMDPAAPGFDSSEMDDLLDAARSELTDSQAVTRLRIIPCGQASTALAAGAV